MAYFTTTTAQPYFNTNWAILSTIGICYVFVGIMVAGIKGRVTALLLVPIVVSAACAIANGLHYYQTFVDCPTINQAVTLVLADVAWMIQEAGLPFYGYIILTNVLHGGGRVIFLSLFWALMLVIIVIRIAIIAVNVRVVLDQTVSIAFYSTLSSRLHIGYFLPIAMTETISAIYLFKAFRSTLRPTSCGLKGGRLFRYLMRSTEIRVSTMAFIGIARTITYSFNMIGNDSPVIAQVDTFIYALGCLFPIVMFIDIVATRQAYEDDSNARCNMLGRPLTLDNSARSSDPDTAI